MPHVSMSLFNAIGAVLLFVLCVLKRGPDFASLRAPLAFVALALFTQSSADLIESELAPTAELVGEVLLGVAWVLVLFKAVASMRSEREVPNAGTQPNKALQQTSAGRSSK